jgi:signal transduction histidine kinase
MDPMTDARPPEELAAALARETRVSAALREVGNALGTTLDLDDLLELILSKLTELVEADRATLYLLDESSNELVSRLVMGSQIRSIRLKVGHGIAGLVAQTGRSIRIKDAYQDARFEREWDLLTSYRTTSMLAAPLKNHLGRTIGVIQVLNKQKGAEFSDEDEAILVALSTQAAVAIDNSRLFLSLIQKNKQLLDTKEQLERRVRDLELLFDLEYSTARASSLEALTSSLLGKAVAACDARGAALLLAEEESGDTIQYIHDANHPETTERIGVKYREGLLAACMLSGEPIRLTDAMGDSRASPRIEGSFPFAVSSAIVVPLQGEQGSIGAIGLYSKAGTRAFADEDMALLRLIAANASTAIRLFNARLARERSERLTSIGVLLSQVIHDFKTPMTVISGYVQLMADADDAGIRAEYAEEILRQFDVLTSMQREVLDFARGERQVFIRRVYLRKFFADLVRQLQLEIDGRGIELEVEVDSKATARLDEAGIARAIHNLARNAIEAMVPQGGGKLTITAKLQGDQLSIRVSDTGPGIPTEIEGRLFQSFVTAGKKGGTGLGLAIVRKIVEEHGGTVQVQSSPKGAIFDLLLPQSEALRQRQGGDRPRREREQSAVNKSPE